LARQRVMLSHRFHAYYGLIRASRSLPLTYVFASGSSYPQACVGRGARGSPIYSLFLYLRAALRTPVDRMAASGCTSPFALAFASSAQARHPPPHTRRFWREERNEAARFASRYGPKVGSPFTDKGFYFRAF